MCDLYVCLQALVQDVTSHRRMVDSVVDKAQSLLHASTTDNPDIDTFIKQTKTKYDTLINKAKVWYYQYLHIPPPTNSSMVCPIVIMADWGSHLKVWRRNIPCDNSPVVDMVG